MQEIFMDTSFSCNFIKRPTRDNGVLGSLIRGVADLNTQIKDYRKEKKIEVRKKYVDQIDMPQSGVPIDKVPTVLNNERKQVDSHFRFFLSNNRNMYMQTIKLNVSL